MTDQNIERLLAGALLTERVRAVLGSGAGDTLADAALDWRSFPQVFATTAGPWPGFGGAALTRRQVTAATAHRPDRVLLFVGSDLFAYGASDNPWFWDQVRSADINFDRLANYGLTVLDRPLR